jgi:hypothetical protein
MATVIIHFDISDIQYNPTENHEEIFSLSTDYYPIIQLIDFENHAEIIFHDTDSDDQ